MRHELQRSLGVVLVLLLALVHHAAELPLPRELLAQVGEVAEELLADGDKGVLGGDGAVGLDPDEDLGHIRVRHCRRLAFCESWVGTEGVCSSILLYPAMRTLR